MCKEISKPPRAVTNIAASNKKMFPLPIFGVAVICIFTFFVQLPFQFLKLWIIVIMYKWNTK